MQDRSRPHSFRGSARLLFSSAWLCLISTAAPTPRVDVIGVPGLLETREEDTLLDIAVDHDLGFIEVRAANPGLDPWHPGGGRKVALPSQHILPDAPRRGIVINLPELRLYYYPPQGGDPLTFPLGIGGEGKETPVGQTKVVRKVPHPVWIPTASEHAEDPALPDRVEPGPDDPMGDLALYLGWPAYAIHGTNKPYSIGRRDSHGCIRMYPQDIARLYALVTVGTPVTVVDQPVKVGWLGDTLYLEVHWPQGEAESLETTGRPRFPAEADADDLVAAAAGPDAAGIDWYSVHQAAGRRDGMAVPVYRARAGW